MTVEEATKVIESHVQFLRENWKPHPDYNVIEAQRMALQALSENQQYRAIGTVEELKSMKENGSFSAFEMAQLIAKMNRLKEYEAIGTVSEFRELKEKATAIKADGFSDHLLNMGYTKGIKDGYAKAIEKFSEILKAELVYTPVSCEYDYAYEIAMVDARRKIDKIEREMKGE